MPMQILWELVQLVITGQLRLGSLLINIYRLQQLVRPATILLVLGFLRTFLILEWLSVPVQLVIMGLLLLVNQLSTLSQLLAVISVTQQVHGYLQALHTKLFLLAHVKIVTMEQLLQVSRQAT
jgi:uncharacterized membrane protein YvlD (DUF360 family)